MALLSISDDNDAIYANKIEPNDIFMNIPVPKCYGNANMPCFMMISKLIGSVTSKLIFRVIFDSESNQSLIHKRVLPETACVTTCKNLNPMTTLGGTMQLNETVMMEKLHFHEFHKKHQG